MGSKLAVSALIVGCAFIFIQGCAAADAPADEAEEARTSADELIVNANKIVGAFHGASTARPPTFEGIVFAQNGTFFADLDTGIRCIMAPCPSAAHLEGTFSATRRHVHLIARAGTASTAFYGRYTYELDGDKLSLSRSINDRSWSQSFSKEISYCAAAADCDGQGLLHPMCAPGGWTCSAANTCAFKCGGVPVDTSLWPASATKLVAESPGGGFTPPAPPGSSCAVGKQKYTLDRAAKIMTSEICELSGGKLVLETATTIITSSELGQITKAMNKVAIATQDRCGADKPFLSITVTTPEGDKTYKDSFYRCQRGDHTYVDNIDGVFSAMRNAM